ncbi:unnamed protein product [Paramecium octaurelia]|uniref:Uncharacterized protein n=1 Tax=Paramecium octaurelia TaxID=43137 RepID=A0A8S1WCU6_PAROT|nr:unnamed protein product [Paramecium octaurelia]
MQPKQEHFESFWSVDQQVYDQSIYNRNLEILQSVLNIKLFKKASIFDYKIYLQCYRQFPFLLHTF